jgi:hypothetical protein
MNRRSLPIILAITLVAVAACQTAASPSAPSASSTPGDISTASPLPTADTVPADELGPFSCDLPVHKARSVPQNVNIVGVRVGSHDGYDRIVFEFDAGTPEITLDRAVPPFLEDPSGRPLDVKGSSFLQLIMRGGTKQTASGGSSYGGPTDFNPGFPQLVALVEGGDFEAQSTWYLGLNNAACARVMLLTLPDRVVIDVKQ